MPVHLLALPTRVERPDEAVAALRVTEELCLQLDGLAEQGSLLFPAYLKSSLLQHVFTALLPATARN